MQSPPSLIFGVGWSAIIPINFINHCLWLFVISGGESVGTFVMYVCLSHFLVQTPTPPRLAFVLFMYFNYQLVLFDILSVRPLVIVLTQCSDCILVEQITRTSLPPRKIRSYCGVLQICHLRGTQRTVSRSLSSSSSSIIKTIGRFPPPRHRSSQELGLFQYPLFSHRRIFSASLSSCISNTIAV